MTPSWDVLRLQRWGPSLEHDLPPIDIPRDWRWDAANLPMDRWLKWHALVKRMLADLKRPPTVDDIKRIDQAAYERITWK